MMPILLWTSIGLCLLAASANGVAMWRLERERRRLIRIGQDCLATTNLVREIIQDWMQHDPFADFDLQSYAEHQWRNTH